MKRLLPLLLLAACAPAKMLKETSKPARPPWIEKPPVQDARQAYFVGFCTGAETLEAAQECAVKSALAQVSQHIGVHIQSEFRERSTELEESLLRQLHARSEAKLMGLRVVDSYHETLTRVEGKLRLSRHDAYVLAGYSQDDLRRERERQARDQAAQARNALALYEEGRGQAAADPWAAVQSFREGLKLLAAIGDDVALEGALGGTRTLSRKTREALEGALAATRRFALKVRVRGPDEAESVFRSSFAAAMSAKGYRAEAKGAALRIEGDLFLVRGGEVFENRVYTAQGSISAHSAKDDRLLATVHASSKGLNRNPHQAALAAAEEAGRDAAEQLLAQLSQAEGASPPADGDR
ncbi:MAG: hypothetical protein HY554_08425 [Elusimicrobia bacterium]|nr:hypothetical protein [Elusimicrobiota bacterium]